MSWQRPDGRENISFGCAFTKSKWWLAMDGSSSPAMGSISLRKGFSLIHLDVKLVFLVPNCQTLAWDMKEDLAH